MKRRRGVKRSSKMNARITRLENQLKKTIEIKVNDFRPTGFAPVNIDTTGLTYLAFARNLSQGEDSDERVGNKICLLSQTFKGMVRSPAGPLDEQQNNVRLILVENIGYTGVTDLALEDVLEYADFGLYGTQVLVSPYKLKVPTTKKYRVLMDKVITMNKTDNGNYHFTKKITYGTKNNKGKILSFESATDTFPNNHRLVFFAISDSSAANHPDLTLNVRNRYKDG